MHFNKVEMRFAVDQVHTSVVLFCTIIVADPAPLGGGNRLVHLRSLMLQLPSLLVNLGPCVFLILSTPRRYLSSCENGSDIIPYKPESQVCGFGIVPSY